MSRTFSFSFPSPVDAVREYDDIEAVAGDAGRAWLGIFTIFISLGYVNNVV